MSMDIFARPKRVAVVGIDLESNAFAPVTTEEDFREFFYSEGDDLAQALESRMQFDFIRELSLTHPCEIIPILACSAGAGGPCDHHFFRALVDRIQSMLRAAAPVDGVLILGHGAGLTTELDDMDGPYFAAVRAAVGDVPVIATLDLHANISEEMVEAADILVSLRTNPHLDMNERYKEAARLMGEMFDGMRPRVAFVRLPLVTPQVTQLTDPGEPFGDLVDHGQAGIDQDIANVSICPGFAFADSRHNGMAIIVTARCDQEAADRLAMDIARKAWSERSRYRRELISVDEAVRLAVGRGERPGQAPIILADVADNPGGGGRGNTMWLIEALYLAGAQGVQAGMIYDPALVAEALERGTGADFMALFNREEASEFSRRFRAPAKVLGLYGGQFRGRYGTTAGHLVDLGLCCVLEVAGLSIALCSIRQQIYASDFLEHVGLRPLDASTIVVKSRGHFRAGFGHLVRDEDIFEVDAPGLTTPNLGRVEWKGLARPAYPIDPDAEWTAHEPYRRTRATKSP